jgi:hypothetical protein
MVGSTVFKRVSRGLGHAGKSPVRFRLTCTVERLECLPAAVQSCRVVWHRGSKLQATDVRDVARGAVSALRLAL